MDAEQYVVDHHLANVISQSLAAAEESFSSTQSLLNLRHAFVSAAQNGVTVLGATGDTGTANIKKEPVKNPQTIPYPTVVWPASDPLVTAVGGTYLCTDPTNTATRTVDSADPPSACQGHPGQRWYDIGGTSLATPQWAALVSIADQLNGGGLGLINPALYKLGSGPSYASDFFDVTVGNNQTNPSIPGYPATTGWDPVTGLGTPNAANLVPDLVAASH
jgi:subtilase family serine protease